MPGYATAYPGICELVRVATSRPRRRSVALSRRRVVTLRRLAGAAGATVRTVPTDGGHVAQGARQLAAGLLESHEREDGAGDDDDEADPIAEAVSLVHTRTAHIATREHEQRDDYEQRCDGEATEPGQPRRNRQLDLRREQLHGHQGRAGHCEQGREPAEEAVPRACATRRAEAAERDLDRVVVEQREDERQHTGADDPPVERVHGLRVEATLWRRVTAARRWSPLPGRRRRRGVTTRRWRGRLEGHVTLLDRQFLALLSGKASVRNHESEQPSPHRPGESR